MDMYQKRKIRKIILKKILKSLVLTGIYHLMEKRYIIHTFNIFNCLYYN